ncbi:MAG: site-specific integrase [Bdellovibrio sp.]|nr:site-specific integrase [Bdellovibrio sp.]
MPIYQETKNNKTTYTVVATAQINGKQVNRKKRSITSLAAAKRIEIDLRIELKLLKERPNRHSWSDWSEICVQRMRVEFKNSTIMGYQGSLRKWLNPHMGNFFLDEITGSMIHELIFEKIQGLSLEGRRGVLKQVKRILSMAMDEGILARNPAKGISVKVPEARQLILNRTEIDTLLLAGKSTNHPFFNHWATAILTGMRNGELHALNWTDIDFENRVISVTKSWNSKDGIGPTKSTKNRYIPISNELEGFLKNLKAKSHLSDSRVLEKVPHWESGEQAKILKIFCRTIGITPIKFHDLRATFITQMLLRGVPVAIVMNIVGHSTIKTTMRYLRLVAQDTQGATESLGITLPRDCDMGNVVSLFQH